MRIRRKLAAGVGALLLAPGAIFAVSTPAFAAVLGPVRITAPDTNLCMDVEGGSQDDGAHVILWECLPYNYNQQFYLYEVGSPYHYNIVAAHSNKCVDVEGAWQEDGAHILQWHCTGGDNQQFFELDAGGGRSEFQAWHSGKCITYFLPPTQGVQLIQWPCYTSFKISPW